MLIFLVVNNSSSPILGLDDCIKLYLIRKFLVNNIVQKSIASKDEFIRTNKNLFNSIGKFDKKNLVLKLKRTQTQ